MTRAISIVVALLTVVAALPPARGRPSPSTCCGAGGRRLAQRDRAQVQAAREARCGHTHPRWCGPSRRGPTAHAVCFLEWARGAAECRGRLDGDRRRGFGARFGGKLVELPRSFPADAISTPSTSPCPARARAFKAERRSRCLGRRHQQFRRPVTRPARRPGQGQTINGLVTSRRSRSFRPEHTNPPGGLEKYFQDNVIGGFGAFTVVAETHESFGRALTKKLIAEIAGLPQPQLAAAGPE